MSTSGKHTIYIDIDDEITAIIDKVKNAPEKIVALVLPKRATVLQSIVNMKLLKKSALAAKKNIVLITSETGLLPLAGAVGLHVAATLQSKPVVPLAPDRGDEETTEVVESDEKDVVIDANESVGTLAGLPSEDDTETIELDEQAEAENAEEPAKKSKKNNKRFKIPNFDRFRLSFFLGILVVILLIVSWVFATMILPTATIVITTDTQSNLSKLNFTASTAVKDLSIEQALLPAVQKEVKKTDTEKTTATTKKDIGTKATGTITIKNCEDSSTRNVVAGTILTSSGKNFATNETLSVPAGTFSGGGTVCTSATATVDIIAADNGDSYNLAAGNYTTTSSALQGNFKITGTATAGGTSKVVTVVGQEDIDAATTKMKGRLDNTAKMELNTLLASESLKGLDETLVVNPPAVTSTPAVGTEASGEVTVTAVTTYAIMGVKTEYLSQLVKKDAATKIDLTKQSVLDDGISSAVIRMLARKSPAEVQMSLQALVVAGPQLNADSLKEAVKGKKRGETTRIISSNTGVKDVTITYKPFWVLSTPKSVKKITITIQKPVLTNASSNSDQNP